MRQDNLMLTRKPS